MIQTGLSTAEADGKRRPVGQGRKRGDGRRLETVLLRALNGAAAEGGALPSSGKPSGYGLWGEYGCKTET